MRNKILVYTGVLRAFIQNLPQNYFIFSNCARIFKNKEEKSHFPIAHFGKHPDKKNPISRISRWTKWQMLDNLTQKMDILAGIWGLAHNLP